MRDRDEQAEQQNESDGEEDLRCHAGVVVHLITRLAADRAPALDYRTRTMCAY